MADLRGAFAKLDRAEEHLKSLDAAIAWWRGQNPEPIVGHHNPDRTEHYFHAAFAVNPDPIRWGLLAGDCVHNLRSALDHVIWAASLVHGAPPERAEFPIMENKDLFFAPEKNRAGGQFKISGIKNPAARALVERFQPWQGAHLAENDALLIVHEFDRIDKHRVLTPVLLRPEKLATQIQILYATEEVAASAPLPLFDMPSDPIDNNTLLFTVHTPVPAEKVKMQHHVSLFVAIEFRGRRGGVTGTLGNLCKHTRRVIEEFRDVLV